jgi:hypothetical protein
VPRRRHRTLGRGGLRAGRVRVRVS